MPAPLDRDWSWVVALATCVNNIIMIGLINVSGLIYNEMVARFQADDSLVAFIIGFRAGIFSLFAVVGLGILHEFLHSRVLIFAGGLVACLGFSSAIASTQIEHMFVYAVLAGAGHSLIYGPGLVMVGKYFDKRRSLGNGIAVSGTSIGTLVFPFLFQYLLDKYFFLGAMLICGGVCLNCCAAGMLLRPTEFYEKSECPVTTNTFEAAVYKKGDTNSTYVCATSSGSLPRSSDSDCENVPPFQTSVPGPSENNDLRNGDTSSASTDEHKTQTEVDSINAEPTVTFKSRHNRHSLKKYHVIFSARKGERTKKITDITLMKQPLFIIFQIASALYMVTITIQTIFLPRYSFEDGRSSLEITILLSLLGITDFIGRISFGFIGDLNKLDRKVIFVISSTLIGVLACMIKLFTGFYLLLAYHIVYGFLSAAYSTLMPVTLVDMFGIDNMSRALSTTLLLKGIIQIGLSPALGYIKDITGTFVYSFNLIGGLLLFASALFIFIVLPLIKRRNTLMAEVDGEKPTDAENRADKLDVINLKDEQTHL